MMQLLLFPIIQFLVTVTEVAPADFPAADLGPCFFVMSEYSEYKSSSSLLLLVPPATFTLMASMLTWFASGSTFHLSDAFQKSFL